MDIEISIPFTIKALPGEKPEQTAARARVGMNAVAVYLNRVGRPWAQLGDQPPADDTERIATVDALSQEQVVAIIAQELKSHVVEMVKAEGAYRDQLAAAQTQAQRDALVEASFG